jgi:UDP-N-acetylmuramoyl-tripeptide--D-alanyl-D-alanine ligase
VVVPDPGAGLTVLGRDARQRLAGVPVIGITGSTGKTSTKDLTAAALAVRFDVCASAASFNNEIGLPLTLLAATETTGAVVAEMGSRGIGHIAALAEVARPAVGVITNIGLAHTEFFGSRSEVARAKGELLGALPADGCAVLSADDDMTPGLAGRSPAPVLLVGRDATADVVVRVLSLDRDLRPSFDLETPWGPAQVRGLPLRGAHQATNAAFAVAVAGLLGVPPEEAAGGLSKAVGSRWRMELSRTAGGLEVLNDAYNANPASMAAALEALRSLNGTRRFAVLGHMAELGPDAVEEHRRVGRLAAACGLAALVVVGHGAAALVEAAREGGVETVVVDTAEDALAVLGPRLRPGDSVLVKASRVVGLERVALALETWP